jgi:hypothetical protein
MHAGAADITVQDASAVYNTCVREMSLNLTLHEAALQHAAAAGQAANWPPADLKPWQNLRAAFDRCVSNVWDNCEDNGLNANKHGLMCNVECCGGVMMLLEPVYQLTCTASSQLTL